MKVVLIQLNSKENKKSNLSDTEQWITKAYHTFQPDLIALPEMFTLMGGDITLKKMAAETTSLKSETISLLQQLAIQFNVYIHGGSICEVTGDQYFNTTFVISPSGKILATYRKINLFKFNSETSQYYEAKLLSPGNKVVTYQIGNITIGCAICFDLRFGAIFQELIMRKVDVIIIPSAFTYETGQAHWEILCRARAIETQSYLLAPAQTGIHFDHDQERRCYGHSMVVNPWGTIISELQEEVGFLSAELDFAFLRKVRERLPCW